MSISMYGAVRLAEAAEDALRDLQRYWLQLASLHHLQVNFDHPEATDLEPDIANLWKEPAWLRFSVSAEPGDTDANTLFVRTLQQAAVLLAEPQIAVTIRNVWTRIPQWRCLNFMLWHERIADAYLIVEDSSGDLAAANEAKRAPLTQVLGQIWLNHCQNGSEDAAIYRIDLTRLPR